MKKYVVIKCGKWAVYKRENIKKVELDDDTVMVMWGLDSGSIISDAYYPKNPKQFFRELMKDLGVDEETKDTRKFNI